MEDLPKLIRVYRANECLWNPNSLGFYNTTLRDSAWRRIAFMFRDSFTIDQLKSQIRKLKRYYVNECLAIESSQCQGLSHVPRYSFFRDLSFLAATKSFQLAQIRAKLCNEQINCTIEDADAFLLNSSQERMPSVHDEDASEHELSRSGSRSWEQYEKDSNQSHDTTWPTANNSQSIRHGASNRNSGNNTPSVGYSGHNSPSIRHGRVSGYNSPTEDTWTHHRSNLHLRSTSLYSNWPGPKLCGQTRPKKYLIRCKPCAKTRTSEKNYGRYWKRNNEAMCQRLNAELSRQSNEDSYQCAFRRQCNLDHARRRSSGAERHGLESNPYTYPYQAQQQMVPVGTSYENAKIPLYFKKKKRKHYYEEQPAVGCIQQPLHNNCHCSCNCNGSIMMPCPLHQHSFQYQQPQYPQIPAPPTNNMEYPPNIDNDNAPQNANSPANRVSQPIEEPRTGAAENDLQPMRTSDQPQELMENQRPNPPAMSPPRDTGQYEYVDNPAIECGQNENNAEQEYRSSKNQDPYALNNQEPQYRSSLDRRQNQDHPERAFQRDENYSAYESPPQYVVCPSYDRDRPREYRRSRRRHDNDMEYEDYRSRRRSNDYMDERERYSRYRERSEESGRKRSSSRRRDRDDIKYVECPAYRRRSSRRRHYDDEDDQSTNGQRTSRKLEKQEMKKVAMKIVLALVDIDKIKRQ
ncbi:uncharacterized protein Dwil_GK20721 [Drosophila willistoni]|uniref:MADF domain-containing protein n=1 Tax=Drosophila willistoni TaxID=7260 RepID=A0A0Q9X0X9_DROWI|nr:uncharacterized protein Dwil_GK20721 [Drosophila willistoni]